MSDIQLTVDEIVTVYPAMQVLHQMDLPAKQAGRAMRLVRKLKPEFEGAQEKRLELVKKHNGVEDAEKGIWKVPDESIEAFQEEWKPAGEDKITLSGVSKLIIDELDGVVIKPVLLELIEPVLADSEE